MSSCGKFILTLKHWTFKAQISIANDLHFNCNWPQQTGKTWSKMSKFIPLWTWTLLATQALTGLSKSLVFPPVPQDLTFGVYLSIIIDIFPDLYISGKVVGQGFLLPSFDVVLGSCRGGRLESWLWAQCLFSLSSNETQPSASSFQPKNQHPHFYSSTRCLRDWHVELSFKYCE